MADKVAADKTISLLTGTFEDKTRVTWEEFRKRYEVTVINFCDRPQRFAGHLSVEEFLSSVSKGEGLGRKRDFMARTLLEEEAGSSGPDNERTPRP